MFRISSPMRVVAGTFAVALLVVVLGASAASASTSKSGFGFDARGVGGFPTGEVTLTGGGAFDASTGFAQSAGGFRCTADVNQGPLAGCHAGEGVRWDTDALMPSTGFKCTGSALETLKTATTDSDTVVLHADFYRAGDGTDESFTANVIVAGHDLAPELTGFQNVWVQGVGCATAVAHFSA